MKSELGCAVERQSQVNKISEDIDGTIDNLRQRLDRLNAKLSSILKQEDPCDTVKDSMDSDLVPLARHMESQNKNLIFCVTEIDSIIDRLEV